MQILLCFFSLLSLANAFATHVWVEGASGKGENISNNRWYRSVRTKDLSGGDWLATYGGRESAFASYVVKVPTTGTYTLWARANPIGALMHVRVGESENWIEIPISKDKHDVINIASDGKPDMRFLAWAKIPPMKMVAGETAIRFRMSSGNGKHGAIDCFCMTTDSEWKPAGILKPGQSNNWPAPKLTDDNFRKWGNFIRPSSKDLAWRGVRWHQHLDEAADEARELGRPVLLWAMNGHPCGET